MTTLQAQITAETARAKAAEAALSARIAKLETPSIPVLPPATSAVTLDETFPGTSLGPRWRIGGFHCCANPGKPGAPVAYDLVPTVANGILSLPAERRADGWHVSIIDTTPSLVQLYGRFEAVVWLPAGEGLWPAFWLYAGGATWYNEIDWIEAYMRDPTVLAATIHGRAVSGSVPPGGTKDTIVANMATGWHVVGGEWRAGFVSVEFDGKEIWRYTGSEVPDHALPVILNLGTGGRQIPTAATPSPVAMRVARVRVQA